LHPERAALSTPSEEHDDDSIAAQSRARAPLTPPQRKATEKGSSLAHQVLLHCVQINELTEVYQYTTAHEIWKRLADKYRRVPDLERAKASAASLHKKDTTSIQDHEFIQLL
jgi:hypothetical protein